VKSEAVTPRGPYTLFHNEHQLQAVYLNLLKLVISKLPSPCEKTSVRKNSRPDKYLTVTIDMYTEAHVRDTVVSTIVSVKNKFHGCPFRDF
jgi:hypothetical protein